MDNLESVQDLTLLWNFDDQRIDGLKEELDRVLNELAVARRAAIEQANAYKENIKKLIHLLGIAYKERDEARDQVRKLTLAKSHCLQSTMSSSTTTLPTEPHQQPPNTNPPTYGISRGFDVRNFTPNQTTISTKQQRLQPTILSTDTTISQVSRGPTADNITPDHTTTIPNVYPQSSLMMVNNNMHATNATSSMTRYSMAPSSSSSSIMGSFFDFEPTSEFFNFAAGQNMNCAGSSYYQTNLFDDLAKGRPLPEKGMLMQSVQEAGPLLDSLMVAAPLPQWHNPPPVLLAPPVTIAMGKHQRYDETI